MDNLNFSARLLLTFLAVIVVYTLIFAPATLIRLRRLRKTPDGDSARKSVAQLRLRMANLRQCMVALFYLYGVAFFAQMKGAFFTPDNNRPVGGMVLEGFEECFRFSEIIFLVFLTLHLVHWFVSARIGKADVRLDVHSLQ